MADCRFAFDALLKKINPSSGRVAVVKRLHGEVRDWLEDHEYETRAPHSRLIGSYARHTAICDIKDVDVLLFLPEAALDRTPESILRELKKVLKEYPDSTVETAPQRRSIRMDFPDENCTIDLVPAVAKEGIKKPLWIPDRRQQEWIRSDPLGYGRTLSAANGDHGQKLVPKIKLTKAWRDEQMERRKTKSYLLEVIFYWAVTSDAVTLVGKSTAQNLCDFFEHIEAKWKSLMDEGTGTPRVLDPQLGTVVKWERSHFETFMRRIREAAKAARKAIEAESDEDAVPEWKKVFGNLWPTQEEVEEEARCAAKEGQPGSAFVSATGGIGTLASGGAIPSRTTTFHGGRRRVRRGPSTGPRRENDPRRQIAQMRGVFPTFRLRIGRDRQVTWVGTLQPSPSSPAYRLRVDYGKRGCPRVTVLDPPLDPKAPHLYGDASLCLYWPKEWRWTDDESLARTIVAWAALWLHYYEIWQLLGEWTGPSSHDERVGSPR